jgi:hypothetical protein
MLEMPASRKYMNPARHSYPPSVADDGSHTGGSRLNARASGSGTGQSDNTSRDGPGRTNFVSSTTTPLGSFRSSRTHQTASRGTF